VPRSGRYDAGRKTWRHISQSGRVPPDRRLAPQHHAIQQTNAFPSLTADRFLCLFGDGSAAERPEPTIDRLIGQNECRRFRHAISDALKCRQYVTTGYPFLGLCRSLRLT
jgi:hypothetical protein